MATNHVSRRLSWLGYTACAMAGCLWGTGFYFGKLALREMGVGHMVLYRFLFASIGMLPMLWTHARRRGRNEGGAGNPGAGNPKTGWTVTWTIGEVRTLLIASALGIPIQFLLQFK